MELERRQPLDRSLLWRWQLAWYQREGAQAWTSGTVPWRITSTPLVAGALADVITAFAADAGSERVCVVEPGAGVGRLAWLLSRALADRGLRFRYVMTDVARANLDAWRAHPQLRPLFERGVLDVALADAREAAPLRLEVSGETWAPGKLPGTLVVVAGYLFDTLPHQLWRTRGGRLERGVVSLEADSAAPELTEVRWSFDFVRARPDAFLRGYAASLPPELTFLVPSGALRCVSAVEQLGGGRALCLALDKGPRSLEAVAAVPFPGLARHGCVSASVNFHALRAWAGWRAWLEPRTPVPELGVYGIASGVRRLTGARQAFAAGFGDNQPLHHLARLDAVANGAARAEELVAGLRDSGGSPDALLRLAPWLRDRARELAPELVPALVDALDDVWRNHFELAEKADVAFETATVLHRVGQLSHAARFYERSIATRGSHPATAFNLALCRLDLGDLAGGRTGLEQVLALAPGHERARELLARLPPA